MVVDRATASLHQLAEAGHRSGRAADTRPSRWPPRRSRLGLGRTRTGVGAPSRARTAPCARRRSTTSAAQRPRSPSRCGCRPSGTPAARPAGAPSPAAMSSPGSRAVRLTPVMNSASGRVRCARRLASTTVASSAAAPGGRRPPGWRCRRCRRWSPRCASGVSRRCGPRRPAPAAVRQLALDRVQVAPAPSTTSSSRIASRCSSSTRRSATTAVRRSVAEVDLDHEVGAAGEQMRVGHARRARRRRRPVTWGARSASPPPLSRGPNASALRRRPYYVLHHPMPGSKARPGSAAHRLGGPSPRSGRTGGHRHERPRSGCPAQTG